MVNTELDWIEIRLNSTYDFVDYFVVVESPRTFQGRNKPLTIRDNWARFSRYHDKLIYHELEIPEGFYPRVTWVYEDLQRNAMLDQVFPKLLGSQAPEYGDVIIVADVDEIARPEALHLLRACKFPRRLTLYTWFYYYSFQFLHHGTGEWPHPQATYYQGSNTIQPAKLRQGDGGFRPLRALEKADLHNAGWHCSSCFSTLEEFLTKLSSFSHIKMNAERFRQKSRIVEYVRDGRDLWDRPGETYDRVESNRDIPQFILDEGQRFQYLTNRSGPNAGFLDYG